MLQKTIKERILVLDGAMGTMIQRYGLTEEDFRGDRFKCHPGTLKGNNDLLCLTRPDVIAEIHLRYLKAGADIIETNTFNAQRISMADYGMESLCRDINLAACRIARRAVDEFMQCYPDQQKYVVGSVGPTNKTCSMSPDVNRPYYRAITFDVLSSAYEEQMDALLEGGVDAILIETVFDTLNAKAALFAAEQAMQRAGRRVPLMLSVTIADRGGRTLSGQTLDAFLASVSHADIFSVGLNCSFGARDMLPFVKHLAQHAPYYISVYPNAGLPNLMGDYDQTPEEMAAEMARFVDEGWVNIIGGCCGTTDAFIARFPSLAQKGTPHIPVARTKGWNLSGLERMEQTAAVPFVNVGERCNVAGSRKFLRLIKEKAYDEALQIARRQVEDGAMVLDVNMDDGLLDAREEMQTFLHLMASDPDVAKVPVMVDASKWEVIEAGLKCLQGKGIVNSLSLKEGEEVFVQRARMVKRLGAAVVVMAFDEQGQADTYERKIEVCGRAYKLLTEQVQFPPHDIIFDPNVLAVATGIEEHDAYAVDFIRAVGWIRRNLPGAHVSGGVSNLSFSFRGNNYIREAMHAVFLYHAMREGMDMGIVNPATSVLYSELPAEVLETVEDVVLNRRKDAAERLVVLAERMKEKAAVAEAHQETWRSMPVEERLQYALMKGVENFLEADLNEMMASDSDAPVSAVSIIEGPLMAGMHRVGELFGEGKMFLPQVVRTARTMKKAVAYLQPYIGLPDGDGTSMAGTVLLATVKGDVHDIGKNIVSVVMACNGYRIVDLGVMTPAERIVEEAKTLRPDVIGLSGLITPSLEEMAHVLRELKREGIAIPVMIGGATTNERHTALKLAPLYDGPVIWVKDASQNAMLAARFLHAETRQTACEELRGAQDALRREWNEKVPSLATIEEARKKRVSFFD